MPVVYARALGYSLRMKYIRYFVLCTVCVPKLLYANFADGISVGIGASVTSGLNAAVGYYNPASDNRWLRHIGVRADFASTDPLKSAIDSAIDSIMRDGIDVGDGVRIDKGALDAWHGAVVVDYHPFSGAWRLSGGYAWGAMNLDSDIFGEIESAPSQRFYFYLAGDHYYYNGNNFSGSAAIDWNYHGPYFGTGWDWRLGCGFYLFTDFGVVLTNQPGRLVLDIPHEQLYIYDTQSQTWSPVTIPQLDADVARATADANRKLSDIRIYPVVKVGFTYRF